MKKYAILDGENVINLIEYGNDPGNPVPGFDGHIVAVETETAGPGWTYVNNVFIAPQPYESWSLINNVWTPPVPLPDNEKRYVWDELTLSWTPAGQI